MARFVILAPAAVFPFKEILVLGMVINLTPIFGCAKKLLLPSVKILNTTVFSVIDCPLFPRLSSAKSLTAVYLPLLSLVIVNTTSLSLNDTDAAKIVAKPLLTPVVNREATVKSFNFNLRTFCSPLNNKTAAAEFADEKVAAHLSSSPSFILIARSALLSLKV